MRHAAPGTRTLRQATGALGAVALMALGASPAVAADSTPEPQLVLGEMASTVDGLKPGSTYDVPVSFTNTGTEALDKVYVQYSVTHGLSHTELPSNCGLYDVGSYDEIPDESYAICAFDQTVEPGVVYAPEKALTLNVLGHALHDELRVVVDTDGSLPGDSGGQPVPGTGPAVKLVERPDATPAAPGSGEHEGWDDANISVNAVNTADLQVSGSDLSGEVGDTVPLDVKLTNAGPGWVLGKLDTSVTKVRVTIPAGTTVTKNPCTKVATGVYECGTAQRWLNEGSVETRSFKLRIDKAVTGAKATLKLTGQARPYDKNPENDTAQIPLDVTGGSSGNGGGSSSGSGDGGSTSSTGGDSGTSTGGSGSGSSGGSTTSGGSSASGASGSVTTADGDLASTGSGATLPLAGAAAAAVAVGAGAVIVVRRRRAAQQ
ncbi:hypothetical protein OG866_06315 [Streptomyces sp. NBC_00663]|uniref:hypothetical protein n=1 Tax=Streptomyces sp. NBC_00663 TaxID=2975801 RepID=UPI002E309298|nr:hypothetical protein [Streptomyces sp. NBC_00663]